MEGTVKWYNQEKGFGFIKGEDGNEHFVHYSKLPEGQGNIREEDEVKVEFDTVQTEKGSQADNVEIKAKADEE